MLKKISSYFKSFPPVAILFLCVAACYNVADNLLGGTQAIMGAAGADLFTGILSFLIAFFYVQITVHLWKGKEEGRVLFLWLTCLNIIFELWDLSTIVSAHITANDFSMSSVVPFFMGFLLSAIPLAMWAFIFYVLRTPAVKAHCIIKRQR